MRNALLLPLAVALAFGFVLSANLATADDGPFGPDDRAVIEAEGSVWATAHGTNDQSKTAAKGRAEALLAEYDVKPGTKKYTYSTHLNTTKCTIDFIYYKVIWP